MSELITKELIITHSFSGDTIRLTDENIGFEIEEGLYWKAEAMGWVGHGVSSVGMLIIKFDRPVYLPEGSCIKLSQQENHVVVSKDCATKNVPASKSLMIAVLDSSGCPASHITIEQLIDFIKDDLPRLCDLVGGEGQPFAANTRLVALDEQCNAVRIDPATLLCVEEPTPKNCKD